MDRRREHRHPRGPVLHDAGPLRRRRPERRAAAHGRAASPPSSPATPPTCPTARTSSTTGSTSRTSRRSGTSRGRRAQDHRGVRRLPPRHARLAAGRRATRRGPRPHPRDRRDRAPLHRRPGVLEPPPQVQDRDLRASRTWCTRSTTSPSSASSTPSTAPAWTCGSAAACRPTRCSPSASAPGSRSTRCPTCGRRVVSLFRDYGYRRLRTKARLKFLIKDWGIEKFRQVLEDEYLGRKLIDGPAPEPLTAPHRPRRRAEAQERTQRRRLLPHRGPRVGHDADRGRRRRRARGLRLASASPRTRS